MALIRKLTAAFAMLSIFFTSSLVQAVEYNMTEGVTEISQSAYDIHMLVIYVCLAIGILTFGIMFYSMWAHRRSAHPTPATFSHSTLVEIIWTTIPLVILVALAVPATTTLIKMEDTSKADMTILVTASQWKWHYKYLDGEQKDIEFFSLLSTPRAQFEEFDGPGATKSENYLLEVDNSLVIPVGKKVRFLFTSDDVIHSWWIPDFAIKQDAIPGFINDAWTNVPSPGIFRGQCTELCGKDHGFMPIVVEVKSEADFNSWVAEQKGTIAAAAEAAEAAAAKSWTMEDLMAKGKEVYEVRCAVCHKSDGSGIPPVFPGLVGGAITTGPIEGHLNMVVHGKAGTAMQAFGAQLTDAEIAAVVTYERNAWGNDKGDLVQPGDVAASKN
ncbi:MAG: cytochrome c oxidase subunit II [Gammaproteobacteria bacterium]|nr:MAG: cytochrome c oxidase subunit II [Gammaproteobacteria bacterium]